MYMYVVKLYVPFIFGKYITKVVSLTTDPLKHLDIKIMSLLKVFKRPRYKRK